MGRSANTSQRQLTTSSRHELENKMRELGGGASDCLQKKWTGQSVSQSPRQPAEQSIEGCSSSEEKPLLFSESTSPILSYPILSYPILSYPILSYPILSYPILSYPILSYPILSYPILSYPILSYPILSYPILSYPILSYPILSYPILSYPILSSPLEKVTLSRAVLFSLSNYTVYKF